MKKRVILWWMLFVGIIAHMFQMTNINVAIISMVVQPERSEMTAFCNAHRSSNVTTGSTVRDAEQSEKLDWKEDEQNTVIGAFFVLTWAAELVGGVLSHKYGSKVTFGLTNFLACALSAAIPFLAPVSYGWVALVRALQGAIGSIGLPAGIATIIGQWSPPDERGIFYAVTLGMPLGISIGYPFFGFVQSYLSWHYVFHITAAIGTLWYIFWIFTVYDTPDKHPRISEQERIYLNKSLAATATNEKLAVPWKQIFTSVPVLANIFCTFGTSWSFVAIGMYMPTYLKSVHDLDSQQIGLITGFPFLVKSLMQIVGGIVTDSMIKRGMSRTRVRNIVTFTSIVVPGFILFGMLFTKCDVATSSLLVVLFIIAGSFSPSGPSTALIDMSPNFCGILSGISCAISTSSGYFASKVFDYLSSNYDMLDRWGYFFCVIGLMNAVPGLVFILFGNSELQSWNGPKHRNEDLKRINTSD